MKDVEEHELLQNICQAVARQRQIEPDCLAFCVSRYPSSDLAG